MKDRTIRRQLKTIYKVHPKGAGGGSVGITLHPDLGFVIGDEIRYTQLLDGTGKQIGAEIEYVGHKEHKKEVVSNEKRQT